MSKSKANAWQIISAILAAIASVFSSLRKSHDDAHVSDAHTDDTTAGE